MASREETTKLNKALGIRVSRLREAQRLSRKELAERLELSEYFLVEIESGRRGVSTVTLRKLAEGLCTTVDYLLLGREEFSDISSITSMLATVDPPLVKGAEEILRTYLGSVSGRDAWERTHDAES